MNKCWSRKKSVLFMQNHEFSKHNVVKCVKSMMFLLAFSKSRSVFVKNHWFFKAKL